MHFPLIDWGKHPPGLRVGPLNSPRPSASRKSDSAGGHANQPAGKLGDVDAIDKPGMANGLAMLERLVS
ncbi:hypothetical protein [Reyranella sp.]|uniref:hypothetical protein n=1 Tax=Reyranella sp. TaxID=1929291 RepID=UPI003C7B1D16